MVEATYKQLLADHERIDKAADLLLADLEGAECPAGQLVQQLDQLGAIVAEHLAVEDRIVVRGDRTDFAEPWREAWREGREAYLQLRGDWSAFRDRWTPAAIEDDMPAFRREAMRVLTQLRGRLDEESRSFYASSLHKGLIGLR